MGRKTGKCRFARMGNIRGGSLWDRTAIGVAFYRPRLFLAPGVFPWALGRFLHPVVAVSPSKATASSTDRRRQTKRHPNGNKPRMPQGAAQRVQKRGLREAFFLKERQRNFKTHREDCPGRLAKKPPPKRNRRFAESPLAKRPFPTWCARGKRGVGHRTKEPRVKPGFRNPPFDRPPKRTPPKAVPRAALTKPRIQAQEPDLLGKKLKSAPLPPPDPTILMAAQGLAEAGRSRRNPMGGKGFAGRNRAPPQGQTLPVLLSSSANNQNHPPFFLSFHFLSLPRLRSFVLFALPFFSPRPCTPLLDSELSSLFGPSPPLGRHRCSVCREEKVGSFMFFRCLVRFFFFFSGPPLLGDRLRFQPGPHRKPPPSGVGFPLFGGRSPRKRELRWPPFPTPESFPLF